MEQFLNQFTYKSNYDLLCNVWAEVAKTLFCKILYNMWAKVAKKSLVGLMGTVFIYVFDEHCLKKMVGLMGTVFFYVFDENC